MGSNIDHERDENPARPDHGLTSPVRGWQRRQRQMPSVGSANSTGFRAASEDGKREPFAASNSKRTASPASSFASDRYAKKPSSKFLLHGVSASFTPGSLNAIVSDSTVRVSLRGITMV